MRSNREIFWFWKTIVFNHVNSSIKVLDVFQELGLPDDPNNSLLDALEHFVVQLYCQNKIPRTVTNLSEHRWYMFSKRQTESIPSPLTRETLRQKAFAHIKQLLYGKSLMFHIKIYLILKITAGSGWYLHLGMKWWQHCSHLLLRALYI